VVSSVTIRTGVFKNVSLNDNFEFVFGVDINKFVSLSFLIEI
jgi:hypothetical protein